MAERLRMLDGVGLPSFCSCFIVLNSQIFQSTLVSFAASEPKEEESCAREYSTIISSRVLRTITSCGFVELHRKRERM